MRQNPVGQFAPRAPRVQALGGRARLAIAAISAAAHIIVLGVLLLTTRELSRSLPSPPLSVALVDLAPLPRQQPPAPPKEPSSSRPRPQPARSARISASAAHDPSAPQAPPAELTDAATPGVELTAAQLAGAASADGGGPGGVCDMARRLQAALRHDPLVQAAVAPSAGKAIMVWNGDWVRSAGEDGKGLAALREAMAWEIAFAPRPCRSQPVRGLVLLSLNPARGAVRLAIGADHWRWSDLLVTPGQIVPAASSLP